MNVHGFLFKLQCLGQLCFEVFVVSIYAEEHLHTIHMSTFPNLQAMLLWRRQYLGWGKLAKGLLHTVAKFVLRKVWGVDIEP